MGLVIENVSGVAIEIDDLGYGIGIGGQSDLVLVAEAVAVANSANGGDLQTLITSGDIVIKDPIDNATNLSVADALAAVRSHNDTHFRMPSGGRIADAIDVDLSAPGTYLRFNGTTFERQTPAQVASEVESNINFDNIQGGHESWRIIDSDGDTYVRVEIDGVSNNNFIEFQTAFAVQMQIFDGQINLISPTLRFNGYPDTRDDGATTTALYVDSTGFIKHGAVTVDPATISHNALADLTLGDPHTQYVKKAGDTMTGDLTMGVGVAIQLDDGSETAPALKFDLDGDTGIFRDTNNQLAITTLGQKTAAFTNDGLTLISDNPSSGSPRITLTNTDNLGGGSSNSATIFFSDGNLNLASTGGVGSYDISIKDGGDIEFFSFPNTRDDGPTTKALYVDATGNLQYGDIAGAASIWTENTPTQIQWETVRFDSNPAAGTNEAAALIYNENASQIVFSEHNANPAGVLLRLRASRGTFASPSAVLAADPLAQIGFQAYNGTDYITSATIQGKAVGDQTLTNRGSELIFSTVPQGSTSIEDNFRVRNDRQIQMYDYPDTRDDGPTTKALYTDQFGTIKLGDIAGVTPSDLAGVQVRRATTFAVPTTYTDVQWSNTDVENRPDVIEHNNTNTDDIDIKESGLYLILFNLSIDATAGEQTYDIRIRRNNTTTIPGSTRTISEDDEINDVSNAVLVQLTAGDVITMQVRSSATGSILTTTSTFAVVKQQGEKGAEGPPGSGSTILVADEGVDIAGTPNTRLNFIGDGVVVTDGGSGVATITIAAGGAATEHDRQMVSSSTIVSTTSQTFIDLSSMTLTSNDLGAAGTYVVSFSSQVSQNGNGVPVDFRLVVDGVPLADSEISYVVGRNATANADYGSAAGTWLVTGVTVGTVIKIQWKVEGNTGRSAQRRLVLDGVLSSNVVA